MMAQFKMAPVLWTRRMPGGNGGRRTLTGRRKSLMSILLFLVLCQVRPGDCVNCNEFNTCFTITNMKEAAEAAKQDKKDEACQMITTALNCLDQAQKDCDAVKEIPQYIVNQLGDKRINVTSYRTAYCVSEISDNGHASELMTNVAAIVLTVLISLLLTI